MRNECCTMAPCCRRMHAHVSRGSLSPVLSFSQDTGSTALRLFCTPLAEMEASLEEKDAQLEQQKACAATLEGEAGR